MGIAIGIILAPSILYVVFFAKESTDKKSALLRKARRSRMPLRIMSSSSPRENCMLAAS